MLVKGTVKTYCMKKFCQLYTFFSYSLKDLFFIKKSMQSMVLLDFPAKTKCGLNVHNCDHLGQSVRNWGPLWAWSCFGFESLNSKIIKQVHGTRKACSQVNIQSKIEIPLSKMCHQIYFLNHFLKLNVAKCDFILLLYSPLLSWKHPFSFN